jgi:hypothetical protein
LLPAAVLLLASRSSVGARLMLMVLTAVLLVLVPSLTTTLMTRGVRSGDPSGFEKVMARIAAW